MRIKPNLVYWWLPLFTVYMLAYCLQVNLELHKDVSILSHTAALMLEGQTYAHDIFEPNPPLIFYLHFIPVLISKITGINILIVLRLYIIALIALSVSCSRRIFLILFPSDSKLAAYMTWGLAVLLLFLPAEDFGQREHLLLILTMPYVLLTAARLDQKTINPYFALFIGVIAGLGFAIKPFFLPTLALLELGFLYQRKSLWGGVRLESTVAIGIIVTYGLCVILFYPDYWHIVLPIWLPYYQAIAWPWEDILTYPSFLFSGVAVFTALLTTHHREHASLKTVLCLSIIGYIIAYLIPRVVWYYHVLPALTMSCLYFVLIFSESTQKTLPSRGMDIGMTIALALLIFTLPIYQTMVMTGRSIVYFHSENAMKQLTTFLNHQQHNTYAFLSMTHQLYTLEFYSNARYVGSFPFCGWEYHLPGAPNKSYSYALNVLKHDLDDKKPAFVIVDIPSTQHYLKKTLDFPIVYSTHKNFRDAWSHYRYLGSIKPYDLYERIS